MIQCPKPRLTFAMALLVVASYFAPATAQSAAAAGSITNRLNAARATLSKYGFDLNDISTYPIAQPFLESEDLKAVVQAMDEFTAVAVDPQAGEVAPIALVGYALAALCIDQPELVAPLFAKRDYKAGLNANEDYLLLIAFSRLGNAEQLNSVKVSIKIDGYSASLQHSIKPLKLTAEQQAALDGEFIIGSAGAAIDQDPSAQNYRKRGLLYMNRAGMSLEGIAQCAWIPMSWTPESRMDADKAGKDFYKAGQKGLKDDFAVVVGDIIWSLSMGNYYGAEQGIDRIRKENPQSAVPIFLRAIFQYQNGRYSGAKKDLDFLESAGVKINQEFKDAVAPR